HAGREREIFQVGAELIGLDDVAADGEILTLLVECLRSSGLKDFTISLGHVGFFKGLLARSGLSPEGQKRAEHAAAKKALPKLEQVLRDERVAKDAARQVLEAPALFGRGDVLERGRVLAGRDRELSAPLDRLERVYRLMEAAGYLHHIVLDLGELRGFDYYDGVVFDVFADGLGCELGGGGRYNHLIGRFGRDLPSTGFALDVDRLFRARPAAVNGALPAQADILLTAVPPHGQRVLQIAQTLRAAGFRVVQEVLPVQQATEGAAVAAAIRRGRGLRPGAIVILGLPKVPSDQVLVLTGLSADLDPGEPSRARASSFVRRLVNITDLPSLVLET
ncbi:MAG: ATP phosphoribosyltransferase regulatory subunit, partial [Nitrospirales bacterium]